MPSSTDGGSPVRRGQALKKPLARYGLAVVTVAVDFVVRRSLEPATGTGAPYVLFFGAVVVTSVWGGPGPGAFAVLMSAPLAAFVFITRAGFSERQAAVQAALFVLDGFVVVYLSFLMRRARRAAESSEARQRETLELAPVAFFLADLQGRLTDVNGSACRMLGYTREELIGKTIADIISTEDVIRLEKVRARLLTPGQTHQAEWRLIHKDGTAIPVELSSNILPGDRWQAFVRDISERKCSEEALRLSEARFSGIIAISADAIISIDENDDIVLFNQGAEAMFGYTRAEAIGAPLHLLIPEELRDLHRRHVADFAAGQATSRRMGERLKTIRGRRKNGEQFPAEAAISKLALDGSTVLTVAVRDVTEHTRIEADQRFLAEAGTTLASSLDYEQTLTSLGRLMVREFADWCLVDVVESRDLARRLRVVSARAEQESICAQIERLRIDRSRPYLAAQVFRTRQPCLIERLAPDDLPSFAQSEEHLRLLRAMEPRSVISVPLMTHGQMVGIMMLISSSPARVYKPADLRLAEALAERAALAIENGRLYRAALSATQFRDEVLGVVAHDLRNPVASIMMQASAIQRGGGEVEGRNQQKAEAILRAAQRMNRLIGDLLDVTLIEAGHLSIQRERLSAPQLVREAVEAQRPLAASDSIDLRMELAEGVPDISGDQHRLLQVLQNLIGNAIKFTPAEGRIVVGAAPRLDEVLFWVADTGCGIAPDGLPHVFDRFWQARTGTRRGAGLGLPITRGIVEAHGGRVWAESTLGRGSIFFFTVPRARHAGAQPESAANPP